MSSKVVDRLHVHTSTHTSEKAGGKTVVVERQICCSSDYAQWPFNMAPALGKSRSPSIYIGPRGCP